MGPSRRPTPVPTLTPTAPTPAPTFTPTAPTPAPTVSPTPRPTNAPTKVPSRTPTVSPTPRPTQTPSTRPSQPPTSAPTYVMSGMDFCPSDFQTTANGQPVSRLFSGGATPYTGGGYLWYANALVNVTCHSNTPANCFCRSGTGANVGGTLAPICCTARGITETWRLQTTSIPNNYAVMYGSKTTKVLARSFDVDIPACPHKYLNLDALGDQDENEWATLGLGPIGFSLAGVPIYPPFTTSLAIATEGRDR